MNYLQNNKQFKAKNSIKNVGFTLIELIITIAIAAIVLAIAVPSFQRIIEKNRISSETDRLFTILKQARNNAIVTGSPSFVCRTSQVVNLNAGPFVCSPSTNGEAGEWTDDFLLYTSVPNLNIPDPDADFGNQRIDQVSNVDATRNIMIQGVSAAPRNGISILASQDNQVLRFEADGSLANAGPYLFAICDNRRDVPEETGRIVQINQVGVIRVFSTIPDNAARTCTP